MLFVHQALSLSIAKASLEELTVESNRVVVGRIIDIDYQWQNEARKTIETVLTIAVESYVKGEGAFVITVKQLGGKMGDLAMEIPGTPQFDVGDEIVFFLVEHQGSNWIHSIALGAFSIVTENNGEKLVINHLEGVDLIDPQSGAKVPGDEAFPILPLQTFLSNITSYIR